MYSISRLTKCLVNCHQDLVKVTSQLTSTIRTSGLNCRRGYKDMPTEPVAARALKKQRLAKMSGDKYRNGAPGVVALHVVGNGGPGNPTALLLRTDHHCYLFNCGEATQRLTSEHGLKLSKLEHIFITRPIWDNLGGLPGLAMTLQGIGMPSLRVHSPKPIRPLFEMARLFSITSDLDIIDHDYNVGHFGDPTMDLTYVPISRIRPERNENDVKKLKVEDQGTTVLSFIVALKTRPGSLDINKCRSLGVPRGPFLGRLKNGEDITLLDGRIIRAVDVCEPDEPGPIFIVIDCPSEEYIESLTSSKLFDKYQNPITDQDVPMYIVHLTPDLIATSQRYKEWSDKFPPSTHQLVLNKTCPLFSMRSAGLQVKLGRIDKDIFPELSTSADDLPDVIEPNQSPYLLTETRLKLNLRPIFNNCKIDKGTSFNWNRAEFEAEVDAIEDLADAITTYKENVANLVLKPEDIYPEVVFLGTASACPGKDRNVSSILVNTSANSSILLDAGEGTYGQLVRFFGTSRVKEVLKNIKATFISHHHADHHLGLVNILLHRSQVTSERMHIICPQSIKTWLADYSGRFESLEDYYEPHLSETCVANSPPDLLKQVGLVRLQTARVKHCRDSFGVAFTTANELFKLAYSGDACPPNEHFQNLITKCDLLIHEATMEDELEEEAMIKRHATTSQAINVATTADAKNLILTHFSQRYAKMPIITDDVLKRCGSTRIGVAFDNMRVRKGDLERLPLLLEPLNLLFNVYLNENKERTARKQINDQIKATRMKADAV